MRMIDMNAVEFLDKVDRLSKKGTIEEKMRYNDYRAAGDNVRVVEFVEQWSAEHPIKTRQSVFLEQYPDADISDDGLPDVAPCQLCVGLIHGKSTKDCENRGLCKDCRRKFWLTKVE